MVIMIKLHFFHFTSVFTGRRDVDGCHVRGGSIPPPAGRDGARLPHGFRLLRGLFRADRTTVSDTRGHVRDKVGYGSLYFDPGSMYEIGWVTVGSRELEE